MSKRKKLMLFDLLFEPCGVSGVNYITTYQHLTQQVRRKSLIQQAITLTSSRTTHIRITDFHEQWINKYVAYDFFMHFRLTRETYQKLLREVGLIYSTPIYRGGNLPVPLEKSVLVSLWYFAKNDSMISTADRFNLAVSTVSITVEKLAKVFCHMGKKIICWPKERDCAVIAEQFFDKSTFPGIIGAIDGTHFICKVPNDQHDSYQDRYMNHSVTMQAICTQRKLFTNVFIGFPGSAHDARVFRSSTLYKNVLKEGEHRYFYGKYHLVGDSAYPCLTWLMTKYRENNRITRKQKHFNGCLSKARVSIENAFGLLKGRWRVLKYLNLNSLENIVNVINACCVLHNFCLLNGDLWDVIQECEIGELEDEPYIGTVVEGASKRDRICDNL